MTNTILDVNRHKELLIPEEFTTPIHVIGAGATGSWVVLQLAKLGLTDITVWDFDKVEAHNVPNQAFGLQDIGYFKGKAIQQQVGWATGTEIKVKNERFETQRLTGIVFMMIDTMKGRKEIWERAIKLKPQVKHLIEPRMGLDVGRIYNVNPLDMTHIKQYEDTFYSDDVAEVSACGTSMTVITTAMSVASMCVRQLLNLHNDVELDNEILIDFKYNNIIPTRW